MPTNKGKVTKVKTKPIRTIVLTVPASPGPPPIPEEELVYMNLDDDDFAAALVALSRGTDTDVEGTPPACSGVTVR